MCCQPIDDFPSRGFFTHLPQKEKHCVQRSAVGLCCSATCCSFWSFVTDVTAQTPRERLEKDTRGEAPWRGAVGLWARDGRTCPLGLHEPGGQGGGGLLRAAGSPGHVQQPCPQTGRGNVWILDPASDLTFAASGLCQTSWRCAVPSVRKRGSRRNQAHIRAPPPAYRTALLLAPQCGTSQLCVQFSRKVKLCA